MLSGNSRIQFEDLFPSHSTIICFDLVRTISIDAENMAHRIILILLLGDAGSVASTSSEAHVVLNLTVHT